MELRDKRVGVALTGSFCTFSKVFGAIDKLAQTGADIYPIMSETSAATDTRFGRAEDFIKRFEAVSGKQVIRTIAQAEPIGPKGLLDLLIVVPCTGNTAAKLAWGVTDTSVTMAVKAHLRNSRPVLIGISTNDGLGNAAKNIGMLQNSKNIYMIPYRQDDHEHKPNSLVADFDLMVSAAEKALDGCQLQPVLL